MFYGVAAYLLWGIFPAFFPLLEPASPLEIIAHRIIWTAVFMSVVLSLRKKWPELRAIGIQQWVRLGIASAFIAANWLLYVAAVNSAHITDAALGYFINPLINVLLGVIFLHERLRPLQKVSVFIAAGAVLYLTIIGGQPPYIGLGLALSFGLYGLMKKQVTISAEASLTAETLVLSPLALLYLIVLERSGSGTFFNNGTSHIVLLISAGLVTAIPLLLFGMATKFLSLSTIGMLQYSTPTMQMAWALLITHEHLAKENWIGFIIIWISVAIYITDLLRSRTTKKSIPA
ncbi:RarD protein [Corynebacterium kutscheri]|uniref:RarD protein n=1 Tax=Corynebacterium kutscheri TaxID=35755 RepID=A0A0F6TD97_9CORY|nr:EamA family transporter RarD [Corynebacterium kutscheri]AKE41541.1 rarD protein [Corynebacterium kutscheri]VEH08821.1 RarD protein [Corynebacterium kutscheri]VEH09865.1 RarD protein [Corynebacterium kutscheri]VEH79950.1 RarD protein [Corynebacterium kutscheri]